MKIHYGDMEPINITRCKTDPKHVTVHIKIIKMKINE